jgi:hypothetical protein
VEAEYRLEVEVARKAGGVITFTGSKPSPMRFSAMTFRYQYKSLPTKNEFEPTTLRLFNIINDHDHHICAQFPNAPQ